VLSAKTVFDEIVGNDDSFRLFASIAAVGESQGGWENARIAALLPDSLRDLEPKVVRHGKDEAKHGRIFNGLLHRRGLQPCEVPADADYTSLLERRGIGLRHEVLRRDEPLSEHDVIVYLAHSRVTEHRAAEQMHTLLQQFADHPLLGRAIQQIAADERNHLAYCTDELLRLAVAGHDRAIRAELRACARAEIAVHRDVSHAFVRRTAEILGWSRGKRALLAFGVNARYVYDRLIGWRRMVALRPAQP
jgi:hypothetical protein